jgi:excisionase family DNA binding protein
MVDPTTPQRDDTPMTDTANVPTASSPAPLLYTPAEAARALGISRSSLYVLLADGTIPSVRIGASRRIRRRELVAYADGLEAAPATQAERRIDSTRSRRTREAAAIDISTDTKERR